MRWMIGSVVGAAALVGCASPDTVALEHRSELSVQSRGVQLSDDGSSSHVGMFGTTCEVGTQYAMVGEDFDFESDTDTVVDAVVIPGVGMTTAVITPDHVNLTTPDLIQWSSELEVRGVLNARFVDGGFVALQVPPESTDTVCSVGWYDSAGEQIASAASLGVECTAASDLATDPATGTAWVSTSSGVVRVTADGTVTPIDGTANARLAWDASAQALYVGAEGSSTVEAFEMDGVQRWSASLPGELTALASMGDAGNAAVSVTLADGSGEFIVLDGATGDIQTDLPTPSAAQALDVSGDGAVLAVTLPGAVHYFDILSAD